MIISKFEPTDCRQLKQVIKSMILDRGLKRISSLTQKPKFEAVPDPKPPSIVEFERVIKVNVKPEVIKAVKNKHKEKRMKMEMKLQEKYNRWLLNYLHKTSLLELDRGQHPLSMLGTMEQPDYPGNYEEGSYRKEFPHCSHIVKLTDIPRQKPIERLFLVKPRRNTQWQRQQNLFRNTAVRLRTVIGFIYKFMKSKQDNFDTIAQQLNISIRNTKLLFDLFSCCFKLQREHDKLQRFKVKEKMFMFKQQYLSVCRNFQQRVLDMFREKESTSKLIPRELLFVNLEQLHQMILESQY